MQLNCPRCTEPIPAANINIQRMTAVCPRCDTVFQFDLLDSQIKRRKVKQPEHITVEERDDQISLAFRTNFRLDKNEAFLSSVGLSVLFTFITAILINQYFTNPASALSVIGFGLVTLCLYYWLALIAFNKTYIEVGNGQIKVSRKPLPNLLMQPNVISFAGIERIRYEETVASKQQGYDTPRYNVWAETEDGHHKFIVGDVVEDYAVFISQQINQLLDPSITSDVLQLSDNESASSESMTTESMGTESNAENEQFRDQSNAQSGSSV